MSADRTLSEIVFAKETELRPLRYESAAAFAASGIVLLEKQAESATPYEITFSDAEIAALKTQAGVVFTHNHPQGWNYAAGDPRRGGNSFSPNDIELACKAEFAEIRAVSPGYRFSMRPFAERFAETDWQAIFLVYSVELENVKREAGAAVMQGHLSREEHSAEVLHRAWTQTALLLGLRYVRSEE